MGWLGWTGAARLWSPESTGWKADDFLLVGCMGFVSANYGDCRAKNEYQWSDGITGLWISGGGMAPGYGNGAGKCRWIRKTYGVL